MATYKDNEVYRFHEKMGFQAISKKDQFEILTTYNYEPIKRLAPKEISELPFPLGLITDYITVTKEELKNYLIEIDYLETQLKKYTPTYDGFWVRMKGNQYEFFERERGHEFNFKIVETVDEIIDIYVNLLGWHCKN